MEQTTQEQQLILNSAIDTESGRRYPAEDQLTILYFKVPEVLGYSWDKGNSRDGNYKTMSKRYQWKGYASEFAAEFDPDRDHGRNRYGDRVMGTVHTERILRNYAGLPIKALYKGVPFSSGTIRICPRQLLASVKEEWNPQTMGWEFNYREVMNGDIHFIQADGKIRLGHPNHS